MEWENAWLTRSAMVAALMGCFGAPAYADGEDPEVHDEDKGSSSRPPVDQPRVTATAPKMQHIPKVEGAISIGVDSGGARLSTRGREFQGNRGQQESAQDQDASTGCDNSDGGLQRGNHINIATGNKLEPELDFATADDMGLYLKRTYNLHWRGLGLFGRRWLSNFDHRLQFGFSFQGGCYPSPSNKECTNTEGHNNIWAHRPDGRKIQ